MSPNTDLQTWTVVWLVAALFLIFRHWQRGRGVGLVLGYIVSFGAIHWLATSMYLLPWYQHADPTLVADGIRESAFGMLALVVGVEVTSWLISRHEQNRQELLPEPDIVDPFSVGLYLAIGLLLQLVLFPIAHGLPSVTALVAAGSTLTVVGISLKCWNAWQQGRTGHLAGWLVVSAGLPFLTVATQGFLGYGMAAMMTIFAFVAAFHGRSLKGLVAGVLVAYLGLSLYVTYMRDRAGIREVVWGGSSLSNRVSSVFSTISSPAWFDLRDLRHVERIDERLNQNYLVGAAVRHIEAGNMDFARGATVSDAVLSIVPRAFWPEKRVTAGSGDLVSTYTGIEFSKETSVGIGQVMEWYVNFGTSGVIFGFLLTGGILAFIDRRALFWLEQGSVQRFAVWYLPGLSLLQVGGSFVEVVSTAGACLVVTAVLHYITHRTTASRPVLEDESLDRASPLEDR